MKKVEKGKPGYLNYKKKAEILRTVIYFAIVAAIFLLGYTQTHTRLNLMTVVAVLGCLPASKALVGVIARFPYPSIDPDRAKEIAKISRHLTVCYDTVITSREKIMPADCFVISGHNLYGYTHYEKVNPEELAKHIRSILSQNGYTGLTVKILNQYAPFLARVEGLDNMAAVLVKIIVWRNYHKLLVSSEEMDRPKRYWIGTLKKKIENYYSLHAKVNNISCIVDKYLEANKIMGINSFFLEQIPGICGILCVGLGCLGAVKGILMNSDINFWGRQLIVGTMFGIAVFLFDRLTDMEHTKRKIKTNLLYYLENILPNRMEKDLKKQNYEKNEKIKKSQEIKKEKEDARQLKQHWGEIASARELQLTDEDIQTLKDFIKDL